MTIMELAHTINGLIKIPKGVVIHPDKRGEGDPQRRRPDISRAREVLDWKPTIDLEEGLARTLPYFQENL